MRSPPTTRDEKHDSAIALSNLEKRWLVDATRDRNELVRRASACEAGAAMQLAAFLASTPFDLSCWCLSDGPAVQRQAGGGKRVAAAPSTPPVSPTPAAAELAHRADCRLMLARGTHERYGMSSPIFQLGGQIEVLTLICEYAEIGTLWLAERLPHELHVLRRQCVLDHRENTTSFPRRRPLPRSRWRGSEKAGARAGRV